MVGSSYNEEDTCKMSLSVSGVAPTIIWVLCPPGAKRGV